jgi:threonine dehydrogenase-like Zn-dependent dehydrogenase
MKAVVWNGPGELQVVERQIPTLREGQALVRVEAAGICATDRELRAGRLSHVSSGVVPGHEITGSVEEFKGDSPVNVGDRVVVDTVYECGKCEFCLKGLITECIDLGELGFTADGGWAEFVCVDSKRLHKIPDHIKPFVAVLAEPFAMPLGALVDCGEVISGLYISIIGDGLASFAFASAALAMGAAKVDVTIKHEERKDHFKKLGPQVQILSTPNIANKQADIGIDSVGNSQSIALAINSTKNHGLVIAYGLGKEFVNDFPLSDLVLRNLRLSGHTNPKPVWNRLVSMLDDGSLCADGLTDSVIRIDNVPDALANWRGNFRTVIAF